MILSNCIGWGGVEIYNIYVFLLKWIEGKGGFVVVVVEGELMVSIFRCFGIFIVRGFVNSKKLVSFLVCINDIVVYFLKTIYICN